MAKTPKEYRRLPGRGMRVDGNRLLAVSRSMCSIWLGNDHLLLVERTGYTETYKRFYFRDIQAVMIRKTIKAAVENSITGILALLFFLWGAGVKNIPGRVSCWIISGLFAVFALINLLRGPTCITHIKTSVQTERLSAWSRLRAARKGLDLIRPRLLEAQGAYFPDELKAALEDRQRPKPTNPPSPTT